MASVKHRLCSVFIAIFAVLILLNPLSYSLDIKGEGGGDYPPPANSDWIISNDTYVNDETITIDGNVTIIGNATLTLKNVTLIFNSSADDIGGMYVDWGATLNIYDSNVTSQSWPFTFQVAGNMTIEGCTISRVWGGIWIQYGDVLIANSTIFNNPEYGVICLGEVTIENCELYSNYCGVLASFFGEVTLTNTTIEFNDFGVICNVGGSALMSGNTISNNSEGGILSELGVLEIHENTIASNGGYGIMGDHAPINATGNLIYDNERWGIYSFGMQISLQDNLFNMDGIGNGEGGLVLEWEVLVEVFDHNNDTLKDVNITIFDKQFNKVWTGETIGSVRMVVLREFEIDNNGTVISHTPFKFKARKDGAINSTFAEVTGNTNVRIEVNTEKPVIDNDTPFWIVAFASIFWLVALIILILGLIVTAMKNRKQ
jgi:hypothetical protein